MSELGDSICASPIIPVNATVGDYVELRKELIALRKFREQVESFGPTKAAIQRAAGWENVAQSLGRKYAALIKAFNVLADETEAEGFHAPTAVKIRKVLDEHTR